MATAQQQQAAQRAAQQAAQNASFMGLSYEQPFLANAQNGTSYQPGRALNFDAPVVPGGYLTRVILTVDLTVNYTPAGSNPYANLTKAAPWSVLNQVNVKFGETQITVHPYFEYIFSLMRGFNRPDTTRVVGLQSTNIQNMLYKAPTLNEGDNHWKFDIEIPLNSVHPASVNGLLPIGQTGTKVQIQAVPATQFVGKDPLENVIDTNGTVTVTGNVTVTCIVRDYHSMATVQQVQPDLSGLATVQTIKPAEINPLTAGSYVFKNITNPYPLVRYAIVVIDGRSSGEFTTADNILGYELDQAENTNSAFFRWDETTGGIERYYAEVRRRFGQDMPDGVLVFDAPTQNVANPSSLGGNAFLDLTSAGYPAARWGVKVAQVGDPATTGITPRAVMYATILNPQGITLA
jgi:hypothetical protein